MHFLPQRPHVAVIGGGISGLAAAFRLSTIAPGIAVTVVERDARLGGMIRTERVDGFVIEGGPDSFLAAKPRGVGLCQEVGIGDRLRGPNPAQRRTYVLYSGRLHELPEGLTGLVPTRLRPMAMSDLLSPLGKARMALDYLLPPRRGDDDESLAVFIERRLGRQVYARLVEPLMAGIYAGDGRQLSLVATFPQLRRAEVEHGGLIKGVLAGRPPAPAHGRPSPFLAPRGGLGELVETLAARLRDAGATIRTGAGVTGLIRATGRPGFELLFGEQELLHADAVVVATPAPAAARLLAVLAPAAATHLRAIPHVSTATVTLAYRLADVPQPLAGYGYVVPRVEGRPILASTWVSSKWPGRAPADHALIRLFMGRAGQEAIAAESDRVLTETSRRELGDVLNIGAEPRLVRIVRWPAAMPQYTGGHLERVAGIERAIAAIPGVALAGNAYRGVGLPDCIASGEAAAEWVAACLDAAAQREGRG